jgi:hypothetical protein
VRAVEAETVMPLGRTFTGPDGLPLLKSFLKQ